MFHKYILHRHIYISNLFFLRYGGPGTQKVTKQFRLGWEEYLASSHNIIIGFADGRGGAGRGNRWLHANYRRLGTLEVEDAITAGRYALLFLDFPKRKEIL